MFFLIRKNTKKSIKCEKFSQKGVKNELGQSNRA